MTSAFDLRSFVETAVSVLFFPALSLFAPFLLYGVRPRLIHIRPAALKTSVSKLKRIPNRPVVAAEEEESRLRTWLCQLQRLQCFGAVSLATPTTHAALLGPRGTRSVNSR